MESIGQLEEKLIAAKKDQEYAEKQEAAGRQVLAQTIDQKKRLEAEKAEQVEEIQSLKAQLSDALKENDKLKGDIFSMTFQIFMACTLSENSVY